MTRPRARRERSSRDVSVVDRELAARLAHWALEPFEVTPQVRQEVENRILDSFALAFAALDQEAPRIARRLARRRPGLPGATLIGAPSSTAYAPEWAAFANTTALRDLDWNDTYLGADFAHPSDAIFALLALAQHLEQRGEDLLRGIVTSYELQIALARSVALHPFGIDHLAHLAPAIAAGLGSMLRLSPDVLLRTIQIATHLSFSSRRCRSGSITTWKSFAPAQAGRLALEALELAREGGAGPARVYDGEGGALAVFLRNSHAADHLALPASGQPREAILDSYPKAYAAEYHAQVLIDLAFRSRSRIPSLDEIEGIVIHCSRVAHRIIGTGGEKREVDLTAGRHSLDHSAAYVFATALEEGSWHPLDSYPPRREPTRHTARLLRLTRTVPDADWTRRCVANDQRLRAVGSTVEISLRGGKTLVERAALPSGHPRGAKPLSRLEFVNRLAEFTSGRVASSERSRFLELVERLPACGPREVRGLHLDLIG